MDMLGVDRRVMVLGGRTQLRPPDPFRLDPRSHKKADRTHLCGKDPSATPQQDGRARICARRPPRLHRRPGLISAGPPTLRLRAHRTRQPRSTPRIGNAVPYDAGTLREGRAALHKGGSHIRSTRLATPGLLALLCGILTQPILLAADAPALTRVKREQLCVTNGVVSVLPDGRLAIDTPSSRAFVRIATPQTAEIRFRYVGPSKGSKPLASGEMRRQIGIKLRAQDTCNLLYVMWHIEPDTRIAVSIKRNPGQHTHQECDARGYVNMTPRSRIVLPKILPGALHSLRAELRGQELSVVGDGNVVWEGNVGIGIAAFDGPVGLRTDNARFEFEYFAGVPAFGAPQEALSPCKQSPGD